jgi:superfamily I DNA/RNA helicase
LGLALKAPDLTSRYLRSGPRPELRRFTSAFGEFAFIRTETERLLQSGVPSEQMVVLHRRTAGVTKLQQRLRGLRVEARTYHALKGLEFEVVFLSQIQEGFRDRSHWSVEQVSEERRLMYMAMTRARERLYLNHEGRWPQPLDGVLEYVDRVPV